MNLASCGRVKFPPPEKTNDTEAFLKLMMRPSLPIRPIYASRCLLSTIAHLYGKGYAADNMGDGPSGQLKLHLAPTSRLDSLLRSVDPQSPLALWEGLIRTSTHLRWTASISGYTWTDCTPPDGFCSINALLQGFDCFHAIPPAGPYGRQDSSTPRRIAELITASETTTRAPQCPMAGTKEESIATLHRMLTVLRTQAPSTRANWGTTTNMTWWAAALDLPLSFCRPLANYEWALHDTDHETYTFSEYVHWCSTPRVWIQILPAHFAHCMSGILHPDLDESTLLQEAVSVLREYRSRLPYSLNSEILVASVRQGTAPEAVQFVQPTSNPETGSRQCSPPSDSQLVSQAESHATRTRLSRSGVRVLMDENNPTWGRTSTELAVTLPRVFKLKDTLPPFTPSAHQLRGGHQLQVAQASDGQSGLSLYLCTAARSAVPPLGVITNYEGPGTLTGDIPYHYLAKEAPVPPTARAHGAYLLRYIAKNGPQLVDASPTSYAGYINDDFQGGNVFFTEDPGDQDNLLIVTRKKFPAGGLYELFIAYGRDYWLQHAYLLPPEALRRCMQYYQFTQSDMTAPPSPNHGETEADPWRDGSELELRQSMRLSPEGESAVSPLPSTGVTGELGVLPEPEWLDRLLAEPTELHHREQGGTRQLGPSPDAMISNAHEQLECPGSGEGVILIVEAVELSDKGLEYERTLDSPAALRRCASTESVRRFRQRMGAKWKVITLFKDVWYHSQRAQYAETCLCLDYNDPSLGDQLRSAGVVQPVRHVLINPVGVSAQSLAHRYPSPLEVFGWVGLKGPRVVWMPDHPDITQLLSAKSHRSALCQGNRIGGTDLMEVWAQSQPDGHRPNIGCRGWTTFPTSVGIMWHGTKIKHTKTQWLMKLHLEDLCPERTLDPSLRWPGHCERLASDVPSTGPHSEQDTIAVDEEPLPGTSADINEGSTLPVNPTDSWEAVRTADDTECQTDGMKTDVILIRRLRLSRESNVGLKPQIGPVPDRDLSGYYGLCQVKGPFVTRQWTGKQGCCMALAADAGQTILVVLGKEIRKPTSKPILPQLPLPNGRWFAVSHTHWDVALTDNQTTVLESRHTHLFPFLHLTSDRESANCALAYSETGHPIIKALRALEVGEWLVAYVGAVQEAPSPSLTTITELDTSELLAVCRPAERPVRAHITGRETADENWIWWEAQQETDDVEEPWGDSKEAFDVPPPKTPNLGLGTINLNGKWANRNLPGLIKAAADHPTKGIDGFMFVDARIPASEVTKFTRELRRFLGGRAVFIHVCPARPPLHKPHSTARADLVGGTIVIVFCKPGLDVLTVTQEEGGFGALTRVHLGVGKQTVLWLGAYIPYPTKTGASSLRRKMGEYHQKFRLPAHPEEAEFWDDNGDFDAMGYTWRLISHSIARSMENSRHIGVILTGDFNQTLSDPQDTVKLQERADAVGLYTSLAAQFRKIGQEYPTHNFCTAEPGKHLDTMFTNLPSDTLIDGGSPTSWEWTALSDHLLVIARFFLAEMMQTKRVRLPKQPQPVTFDLSKKDSKQRISDHFQHLTLAAREELQGEPLEDPATTGRRLEFTCRRWVEMAQEVHTAEYGSKGTHRYRRSAEHKGIRVHLKYLSLMHKVICGYRGGSRPGSVRNVKGRWRALRREIHKWKKEEDKVWKFAKERPGSLDYGTGHTREWWSITGLHDDPSITLAHDMCILRRKLQGAMSRELAADIKQAIKRRDQKAAEGRLKQVVQSTLNLRLPTPTFSQVFSEDRWITDPAEVHAYYTQGWERRFQLPPESLPVQAGLEPLTGGATLPRADAWEAMLDDPQAFVDAYTRIDGLRIPPPLIREIAEAFANNPNRKGLEAHLEGVFRVDFTYEEMVKLVRKSKSTTPGLTGLSYQMLKLLPDECLMDLFQILSALWKDRAIPEFWTFKTLQALPKSDKPNPGVADLRPIGLIEVTRKLWTRMVMARIFSGLKEYHTLQDNQNGGLANKGTDSALMQLLNLLEDGVQTDTEPCLNESPPQIDFTSWDTKMAYDSVGNHVQYAAWRRMGIPQKEVRWLMGLDMFGLFVVLTPYSRAQLGQIRMQWAEGNGHHECIRNLGFTPQRGLTQGDVKSPLGWIAYFDILIRALNHCRKDEYPKVTVEAPVMTSVRPSVYMDDLTTATCSRQHTQEVADRVSAMNALFGTSAAVEKFRAVSTVPGDEEDGLIIHDWLWREKQRAFKGPDHVIRILGVQINLGYTWEAQVKELTSKFEKLGAVLHASRASESTKIRVINAAVILKAAYPLGLAAWPEWALQKIDSVHSRMAKHALRLPVSFPTALIHSKRFGFGVIQLKTHVIQTKERSLNRCLEGPGPQGVHARGIINRGMTDQLGRLVQGGVQATGQAPAETRFISDIFRAGEQSRQRWLRIGATPPRELQQVGCIPGMPQWHKELKDEVKAFDIHFLAELRDWNTGEIADWLTPPEPYPTILKAQGRAELERVLQGLPVPEAIPIRRGHILAFEDGQQPRFFEVSGYLPEEQQWGGFWYTSGEDPYNETENWGTVLRRLPESSDQGSSGAGRCDMALVEQQQPGLAFRMLQRVKEGEFYTGQPFRRVMGINRTVHWDTKPPEVAKRHRPGVAPWTLDIIAAADATGRSIDCLTSDASVAPQEIHSADIWDGPHANLRKQGAIVITDTAWREGNSEGNEELGPVGVIIIEDLPEHCRDSYSNELVMLSGSLQVAHAEATLKKRTKPPVVETDCKSIHDKGEKERSRYGTRSLDNRQHGFAFRHYRRLRWVWRDWLHQWIRSHPERRKSVWEYLGPDARIMLADKFAECKDVEDTMIDLESAKWRSSKYGLVPANVHRVKARDILQGLFSHGDFCWVDDTGCPTTQTLLAGRPDWIDEYLTAREKHAKEGSGYQWSESVLGLYGHWRGKTKVLAKKWQRRAEIMNTWDKTMNGRNLQKCLKLAQPPKCPLCELTADTQAHLILRCSHPVITVAREGFQSEVRGRIQTEAPGPGRTYLQRKWNWVLQPGDGRCTVADEMARVAFLVGRPLRSTLRTDENMDAHRLTRGERAQQTLCVMDLMDKAAIYVRQLERLKMSISAAPEPIQRTLRSTRATVADVKGLLQRPYSAKDQHTKARIWRASIASFCTHRHCTPSSDEPTEEVRDPDTPNAPRHSPRQSVWQPEWLRWQPPESPQVHTTKEMAQELGVPAEEVTTPCRPTVTTNVTTDQAEELPLVSEFPGIPRWALPFQRESPAVGEEQSTRDALQGAEDV